MVSRGEIWLVNLNPIKKKNAPQEYFLDNVSQQVGKVRPILVYQNDELNHSDYPTTIVIPLSTHLIDDAEPIRYRINKKDKLKEDSDVVITQIRAIDNDRFIEKLTTLSTKQMQKVKELFDEVVQ
ncbi:MAG: type II toxin-antitoxin system PemK/MazF family toxin [Campylobacterota bacterium]|nr:type II toxin-antitoxin system PemK/MazF family toxin [Campylobacterota bacterium]